MRSSPIPIGQQIRPVAQVVQASDLSVGSHINEQAVRSLLMPTKVRDLLAQLQADGWAQVGQSGSRRQFRHPSKPGTVTVAGKLSVEVPSGTLASTLKQAGLKK